MAIEIVKIAVTTLLIIALWIVAFLSIYMIIKIPGRKKLDNRFETNENKRKEKAKLRRFMKIYIAVITIFIVLLMAALYIFFLD